MKTLIVYASQTGFTKKYAEWISEKLGADLWTADELKKKPDGCFEPYDEVIYGGWASMGKVVKSDIFYSKLRKNPVKKTAVFCVGAATVDEPNMKAAMKKIVPDDLKGSIKTFYCPGGLNYEKMGLSGKLMMKAFASMLKKDEDKKEQGEMYSHSFDISDKKYINPIVEWARA